MNGWRERQHRPMRDPGYRDEWYAAQCGGCRFWIPLSGILGSDYGACTNPVSPRDGMVSLSMMAARRSRPSAKAIGAERRGSHRFGFGLGVAGLPPEVREWLPPGHLAWFVIDAVEELDLSAFYAAYRRDGRGRPAYEPAMMVALLLYAYARGAAQQRPDHETIARFLDGHQDAIAGLFGEVLVLCARSGLAKVGVIAVDGTKLQADASRDANVDYEQLAREIVDEANAVDVAEDELYGCRTTATKPS